MNKSTFPTHRGLFLALATCMACATRGAGQANTARPQTWHGTAPADPADIAPLGTNLCSAMQIGSDAAPAGFKAVDFEWRDARCDRRSVALVANDTLDPKGKWGGYMRRYRYQADGATRTCSGQNDEHPGFGYVVAHLGSTATVGYTVEGRTETPLLGPHHAIHRYTWKGMPIQGQPVDVTVEWFFATGRDHPLWSVTYDLKRVPADAIAADTRAPYGDIAWDGGAGAPVAGVAWGDHYRFKSTSAPISMQSGWDYSEPNTIPYAAEWTATPDAEMGLVQTQTYLQHDAGGYGSFVHWGKQRPHGPMPENWNWTYQLNQYELPFTNTSKRLAWGSNFGAVGKQTYPSYGHDRQLSGWPFQSYSVFVVLGKHSTGTVAAAVADMEAVEGAVLHATLGSVVTSGPAGVARSDDAPYAPAGWDQVHAAWTLQAAPAGLEVTFVSARALHAPVFHLRGLARGTSKVVLDGSPLRPGLDFYESDDLRDGTKWLTLARSLSGERTLGFSSSPP